MKISKEPGAAWLTTAAAAEALGLTERTIQRRAAKGKIPARKVSDEHGDRWLVQIAPDTDDAISPTPNDAADSRTDGRIERNTAKLPTPPDTTDILGPTQTTASDIAPDNLTTALLAEKDARIADLRAQLDTVNRAFEREQTANAELRRVLAFNLSNPAALSGQAPASSGTTGANSQEPPETQERRSIRGENLAMIRQGLRRLFGAR